MQLPTNTFKRRLGEPGVQYGLFSGLADPVVAEINAGAGFDWLVLDVEHAPNDLRTVLHQLQAIAAYDTSAIVRAQVGDTVVIKKLLDIGAQTLLVPMVESGAQASELVRAVRYPPIGIRGVGPSLARASRWNQIDGYLLEAERELCLVVQVESVAGLAAIEAIAATDGVDGVFVGPSDLAASMGFLGRPSHPDVMAAVDRAIERIVATGTPAGVFATSSSDAERWADRGATFIALGTDTTLLARAASDLARTFRPGV
jgi:4-hydroxy-2-oxoheptanedioate aldolase